MLKSNTITIAILEMVDGLEHLWLIGDEFAFNSYHDHFRQRRNELKPSSFTFSNFEVTEFLSSRYSSNIRNVLARIKNNLVRGLDGKRILPKLIVIVLDDDLTKYVRSDKGAEVHITKMVTWLMKQYERVISIYTEGLPNKAKKATWPHLLWIQPAMHKYFGKASNDKRSLFGKVLNTSVKFRSNMTSLEMKKFWDYDDTNLFVHENYRFTTTGLKTYWESIDSAIRFWNVVISPKIGTKQKQNAGKFNKFQKYPKDRFKWNKSN